MSLGTILLIVLIIILLGGFSGVGRRPLLWDRLLRRWRPRACRSHPFDPGFAG